MVSENVFKLLKAVIVELDESECEELLTFMETIMCMECGAHQVPCTCSRDE
jgi:hypothetical protein